MPYDSEGDWYDDDPYGGTSDDDPYGGTSDTDTDLNTQTIDTWAKTNGLPMNADGTVDWAKADAEDIFGLGASSGDSGGSQEFANQIANLSKSVGSRAFNALKSAFTKPDGKTDWQAIAATAGGIYGLVQSQQRPEKTGYQGGIPKYEAVRAQVPGTYDPDRRPGSAAQNYFTDTKYVAPEGAAAARTAASDEAAGLEALNKANPARQERDVLQAGAVIKEAEEKEEKPASSVIEKLPVPKYASGGIASMARGRYLGGTTDGMADKIPARIDAKQEAKLSHGEFVIPSDVVSHIGNGNSDAGAQRLYDMMDRIRQARTGTAKQGKQVNPNKFLPA